MKRIVSVRCSLANASIEKAMGVVPVKELLVKVDEMVDGLRMESPRGTGTITFIRSNGSPFSMDISEGALPSQTITSWEEHILEVLLTEELAPVMDDSDYGGAPDPEPEQKEPWQ